MDENPYFQDPDQPDFFGAYPEINSQADDQWDPSSAYQTPLVPQNMSPSSPYQGPDDDYFTPAAYASQPPPAYAPPYPQDRGADPAYFNMAHGQNAPAFSQEPMRSNVPPAYSGDLHHPAIDNRYYQSDMQSPGFGPAVYQNQPPYYTTAQDGQAPPDRIPFQAPPKQKNMMVYLYISIIVLVIVLAVMGISQLINPAQKMVALVTLSKKDSTYSGDALIVRNESVYAQEGVSTISYVAEEGTGISRGDHVCTVYTSGFSAKEMNTLSAYRTDIANQQSSLLKKEPAVDPTLQRLDNLVLDKALEIQALVGGAHGSLLNQEELIRQAIQERQEYIKQKYPDDTKLTRLYDNESNQLQRIGTWTKQYIAADNGIVSFYTDGFESTLNINNYKTFTPLQVRDLLDGKPPVKSGTAAPSKESDIYRLVRQNNWSVLMLADNQDWTPVVNDSYQMLIESFKDTTVNAVIESVTRSGHSLLLRLQVDSDVEPILYIRSCRVQLSKSTITYAVPNNALINQDGIIGVVAMFSEGEYLIPVEVISQDATQADIIPLNAGYLSEGMSVRLFNKK